MLQAKWKSGPSAESAKAEPARAGQVRSFRIVKLDAAARVIEVEMA
jgi:small subunit ribosomal protein S1